MSERFRSQAARDLVKAVRSAGGTVEFVGRGKLKITGPQGSVTIHQPGKETRRDLRSSSAAVRIKSATGLDLEEGAK